MPLDGHSYLVAQGWSGKGSGLRHGAISRPLAIPQKRTLAGLGKDRDDAFPFWEHVFSVAAKTIQVKIHNVEDDNDSGTDAESTPPLPILTRTSTGLLSNKRPLSGTPASSGTSTPSTESSSNGYRMSIVASAKREAARKGLYSRFFRGPVLGPDEKIASSSTSSAAVENTTASTSVAAIVEDSDIELSYGKQRKGQEKKRKAEKEKKKSERRSDKEKKKSERRSDEKKEERKKKEKKRETGKEKEDSTYPDPAGEVTSERKRKRSSSKDEKESEKKKSKKQKQKAKGKAEGVDDSGTITTDDLEDEGGERESLNKKSRKKKQQVQDEDGDERRTHDGSSSPSRVRRINKGRKRR